MRNVWEQINQYYGIAKTIFGHNLFVINLPFNCEERFELWEMQCHVSIKLDELVEQLGSQQFIPVVAVTFCKLKTKQCIEGGFCIVGAGGDNMDDAVSLKE